MSALRVALSSLKLMVSAPRLAFRADPVRYYDFLGDDVIEGESSAFRQQNKPLWLNLGYWKHAQTYPEAATAMATLLGEAAQLGPGDRQLDVGFGFAEQDFFWLARHDVAHITGLNISAMQVARARARVVERGLADRLDLQVGSATDMPFAAGSFDKVTALECAHHFPTRARFFDEAHRVLKPGGRLALADGVPQPGHKPLNFRTKVWLRRWASPLENYYDRDVYREKLLRAGFTNVRIHSIGEHVFPGLIQYMEQRRRGVPMERATVRLTPESIAAGLEAWEPCMLDDYLIVSADKPASGAQRHA